MARKAIQLDPPPCHAAPITSEQMHRFLLDSFLALAAVMEAKKCTQQP